MNNPTVTPDTTTEEYKRRAALTEQLKANMRAAFEAAEARKAKIASKR